MKRNWYAAYDFIRQGKFKTPEKISNVENLLREHRIVVNWWCRQSGKTLTNIKISRDFMIENPGSFVLYVTTKASLAKQILEMVERTIDRSLIEKDESKTGITLKNGSSLKVGTLKPEGSISHLIKKIDLLVVDEFEFIDSSSFSKMLLDVKNHIWPSALQRFLEMFNRRKRTVAIFSSSMKNGENFQMIKSSLPLVAINYLNWEKIPSIDRERLVTMLGEDSFQREYNSYRG